MKIYILRHEDRGKETTIYTPLTPKGIDNSEKLIDIFKKEGIDLIFSSPFIRTLQTVYPYSKDKNIKINLEYSLCEIHHKDLIPIKAHGMYLPEYIAELFDYNPEYKSLIKPTEITFPEKEHHVVIRTKRFLRNILNVNIDKFSDIKLLIEDIMRKNNQFAKYIEYQKYDEKDFYKDEWECVRDGKIFSLMNNNFIEYLTSDNVIPHHEPFKSKKKKITPKLRILVWKKEFGDENMGKCPLCNVIINNDINGFHCSHIISEFNGGETILENLRPLCSTCNIKMGKNNW